ncbi:ATP-grasp domain-containing protein [Micromonospora sp. M71_S20]|uniref:ATP-grasp domain-containing protein n=1 Tax=Micromonospora sp. M71_S20 TaxID=592872 RepID=UPI0018F3F015|nr:ATP-grasp domain-containing protein [Micromonospora sp. M71_S20]
MLVTAVGGAPGFDLARVLHLAGYQVIGTDTNPLAAGLFLPGLTPRVVPPSRDARYTGALLDICRSERPAALIPTDESEILRLVELRDQLHALGVRTWLPSPAAMTACHDKAEFHRLARLHGVPTPRTWLPAELDRIPEGIDLVVKPRRGHGGKGLHICHTVRQARVLCELVDDPLVQERISGSEFTADCLIDHDGNVSAITRHRLTVRNGLSVAARTFHDDQVAKTVTATVAALGMTGLCCVQGFLTDDPGRVLITEVNGRIAGAFPISEAAGADLIGQFLNGMFGRAVNHDRLRYTPDIHLIKYVDTIVAGPTPLAATRPIPSPVPSPSPNGGLR